MILKVIQKKDETSNAFSLILEKPAGFSFYAGQYLDIKLPVNDPLGSTRAFTISSSPTEDSLMITPKKGFSVFKKYLERLKPGDTIQSSHPAGTFILDETESAVFLAGGIGITPFRSIIKYVLDQKLSTPITLIYSNSDDNFLFKRELERWKQSLPMLSIIYHDSTQSGHLNITKLLTAVGSLVKVDIFYLAGPPKMVDDFEKILKEIGVDELNIRYDRFDGY